MVGREVQLTVDRGDAIRARPCSTSRTCGRTIGHGSAPSTASASRSGRARSSGIAGVAGNGQDELVEAITGLRRRRGGSVTLDGTTSPRTRSTRAARASGIAFVPADRQRFGLVLAFPLADNLVLTDYYTEPCSRGVGP